MNSDEQTEQGGKQSEEIHASNAVTPPTQTELNAPPQMHEYPRMQGQPVDANNDPLRFVIPVNPSVWAVAAGYAGIIGILLPLAPIAIILGLVALKDLKKNPGKTGKGRAIFGIVAGAAWTVFLIFIIITVMNQPQKTGN